VDHIDNNHKNNDPANLQTLCKNCHSLRTYAPESFAKMVAST
jgi:5-methylcytosine-specific restriction endonuclease McrA